MDLLGLELQALGDLIAHAVGSLRVAPHGQLLRLVVPDRAARPRLHAQGQHPLVHHVELENDVCGREAGVDAGLLDLERDGEVGAGLGIEQWRSRLERLLSVDHDGQRLVVHHDRVGGVGGGLGRLRSDDDNGLAHMTNPAFGEERVALTIHGLEHLGGGRRVDDANFRIDVGAREDGDHSRHLPGRRRVDPLDHRMGVGAAREGEPECALEPATHVVDVGVAARDELGVLEPLEGAAHVLDRHQYLPVGSSVRALAGRWYHAATIRDRTPWPAVRCMSPALAGLHAVETRWDAQGGALFGRRRKLRWAA